MTRVLDVIDGTTLIVGYTVGGDASLSSVRVFEGSDSITVHLHRDVPRAVGASPAGEPMSTLEVGFGRAIVEIGRPLGHRSVVIELRGTPPPPV
jgi:hypothetical protein